MKKIFEWFKNLFKKEVETDSPHPTLGYPQDDTPLPPSAKIIYQKVAIIVGHDKASQGASTYKVNGAHISEYVWNKARAQEIAKHINANYPSKDVKIFYRDGVGISGVAKLVGEWKPDVSFELHFNSIGHTQDAFGSEMLILDGDDLSAKLGYSFISELSKQFKTKLRNRYVNKEGKSLPGIKALKKGDRGYSNLAYIRDQGVSVRMLIEPFFGGTKTEESKQFIENPEKYSMLLGDLLGKLP